MARGNLEDALKITLSDYRLSRGEKRALAKVIEPFADDEHRLAHARSVAFKMARDELTGPTAIDVLDWLEDVIKALQPRDMPPHDDVSAAYFSPDDKCVNAIVRLFATARRSVEVCVFTITDDRITDAILAAHRRNVSIRIISDNDKSEDRGSDTDLLQRHGVPLRLDQSDFHMHHKYAIFDQQRLLTGSYNWTRSAAQHNEENFIVTSDKRLLSEFRGAFERLWDALA